MFQRRLHRAQKFGVSVSNICRRLRLRLTTHDSHVVRMNLFSLRTRRGSSCILTVHASALPYQMLLTSKLCSREEYMLVLIQGASPTCGSGWWVAVHRHVSVRRCLLKPQHDHDVSRATAARPRALLHPNKWGPTFFERVSLLSFRCRSLTNCLRCCAI